MFYWQGVCLNSKGDSLGHSSQWSVPDQMQFRMLQQLEFNDDQYVVKLTQNPFSVVQSGHIDRRGLQNHLRVSGWTSEWHLEIEQVLAVK